MVRELGDVRLGISGVEVLEREADAAMQEAAPLRTEVVVERLADEPVREAVHADRRRPLGENAAVDGLREGAVEVRGIELADTLQRVEPELAPDHRGGQQQGASAIGQRREAVADRLADAVGDAQPRDLRLAVEATLGAQQAHDLVDEERVALGREVDRPHDAVGRAAPGDALDDLADVALAQPA